jgi:cellulose synthase/poly-beta-1,6-N-acetylglucosamine synthase-like glycosyltransferase
MTIVSLANVGLWFCIIVLAIYTLRHYFFTLNRLFGRHRQPFVDIMQADWPSLIVFVPAHNESRVVRDSMDALLTCDYPLERLRIVPIDDRSEDDTRAILLEYAANYPDLIVPFLRDGGTPARRRRLRRPWRCIKARFTSSSMPTTSPDNGSSSSWSRRSSTQKSAP